MSWRDRLLPASFRGARFFVATDTRQGGRRLAVHEYPLRDIPYAEDLGRKARTYAIEAVLVGPNTIAIWRCCWPRWRPPAAGS